MWPRKHVEGHGVLIFTQLKDNHSDQSINCLIILHYWSTPSSHTLLHHAYVTTRWSDEKKNRGTKNEKELFCPILIYFFKLLLFKFDCIFFFFLHLLLCFILNYIDTPEMSPMLFFLIYLVSKQFYRQWVNLTSVIIIIFVFFFHVSLFFRFGDTFSLIFNRLYNPIMSLLCFFVSLVR